MMKGKGTDVLGLRMTGSGAPLHDDFARVVLNEDDIGFGELGGLGGGCEGSVCRGGGSKRTKRVSTLANRNL